MDLARPSCLCRLISAENVPGCLYETSHPWVVLQNLLASSYTADVMPVAVAIPVATNITKRLKKVSAYRKAPCSLDLIKSVCNRGCNRQKNTTAAADQKKYNGASSKWLLSLAMCDQTVNKR